MLPRFFFYYFYANINVQSTLKEKPLIGCWAVIAHGNNGIYLKGKVDLKSNGLTVNPFLLRACLSLFRAVDHLNQSFNVRSDFFWNVGVFYARRRFAL